MSLEIVDLSVLPIDVGFDLRLHKIAVTVPADTRSAAYDANGTERTVRGSTAEIVAALTSAGYECTIVAGSDPALVHAVIGDYDHDGWTTLCGDRTRVGDAPDPGAGRSLRDAGVSCPACLEHDTLPLRGAGSIRRP